jgi:sulfite exporter TauE/SafE
MMAQIFIAGLLLGSLSSFHCVGMCGPIALALPVQHLPRVTQHMAILFYQFGRLSTYIILGAITGWLGHSLFIAGWQQGISIASGITILGISIQNHVLHKRWQPTWLSKINAHLQSWMQQLLSRDNPAAFFPLGMTNGLLPCGMLYLALAAALSSSGPLEAGFFMLAFGTGTLPAMLALSYLGIKIGFVARQKIKKAMPYLVMLVGLLLILRGLNLGIPFISPLLAAAPGKAVICH